MRRGLRVVADHSTDLRSLGSLGQLSDDGTPPALRGQPLDRGHHVAANRAAHAGVREADLASVNQPALIADGSNQHLPLDIHLVVHHNRVRKIPLQGDGERRHRFRVDTTDENHGSLRGVHPCLAFIRGFFLLITKTRPRR